MLTGIYLSEILAIASQMFQDRLSHEQTLFERVLGWEETAVANVISSGPEPDIVYGPAGLVL